MKARRKWAVSPIAANCFTRAAVWRDAWLLAVRWRAPHGYRRRLRYNMRVCAVFGASAVQVQREAVS